MRNAYHEERKITEHQLRNNNIRASGFSAVPEQGLEGWGHRTRQTERHEEQKVEYLSYHVTNKCMILWHLASVSRH
jgi:hypothetical protein